jgi:hypothetical protein
MNSLDSTSRARYGNPRLRARTRISSPSSATSSMTRADSPENTVFTRSLRLHRAHRGIATPSVTTERATGPNVGQTPGRLRHPTGVGVNEQGGLGQHGGAGSVWNDVKNFFDPDLMGALPDVSVSGVSVEDWQVVFDLVRSSGWVWEYREGGVVGSCLRRRLSSPGLRGPRRWICGCGLTRRCWQSCARIRPIRSTSMLT